MLAYFYDELANEVINDRISKSIVQWLSERISQTFEEGFLGDVDNNGNLADEQGTRLMNGSIEAVVAYNLDDSDASVVLNIMRLCTSPDSRQRDSLFWVCNLFRALAIFEAHLNEGSLDAIDACLGAPILYFDVNIFHFL